MYNEKNYFGQTLYKGTEIMKKSLFYVIIVLFIICLLAGCKKDTNSKDDDEISTDFMELTMATGGTSGTYYSFSEAISKVANNRFGDIMNITIASTGASKANLQLLDSGEAQLAIVQNDVMAYAYNASDMYKGEKPIKSFTAVAACYPEQCQIIAVPSIKSIEELRGKRVSVGDAGSGVEFNTRQILEAYNITFDDIIVVYKSFADSVESLLNGDVDAIFVTSGAPTTAITELASEFAFNMLGIDDEHIKTIIDKYGYYTSVIIPGGTYDGFSGDVQTVAVMATIVARSDVPSKIINAFTRCLFEYKFDITALHPKGELLDPVTGISGVPVPFHPGASQYYSEAGIK